jgi:hypothetical protein
MADFLPAYEAADRLTATAGGTITGGNVSRSRRRTPPR